MKKLAPKTVEHMISVTLSEVKAKKGRVVRSPLRHLFNVFLHLQSEGLLLPLHGSSIAYGGSPVPKGGGTAVFPDRLDWVEFLDFVSKVDVDELEKGSTMSTSNADKV